MEKCAVIVEPVGGVADLRARSLVDTYTYWNDLRGQRLMPARREFDPARLARHLALISLVDVIDGGRDYRFRLIGSRVDAALGGFFTNTLVSEYPREAGRRQVQEMYDRCTQEKRPFVGCGHLGHFDLDFVNYETMALPLSEDGDAINMILVVNHFETFLKRQF